MKHNLIVFAGAVLAISLLLIASCAVSTVAYSQETLDVTQSGAYPVYPAYLATSCGGIKTEQTEDGLVAAFSARTSCSSGGRGSKPRLYLACWRVTFATDRYSILSRERVLYAVWTQGQPGYSCPVLP